MPSKAQHSRYYGVLRRHLRELRINADLTQRDLGRILRKPQSWIHSCETGSRRVDLAEFAQWCRGCRANPLSIMERFLIEAGLSDKNV
jgi:hypothetical protein